MAVRIGCVGQSFLWCQPGDDWCHMHGMFTKFYFVLLCDLRVLLCRRCCWWVPLLLADRQLPTDS